METFADVLHAIIDTVFTGDAAEKAHAIIDQASGQRTPQEPAPEEAPAEAPEKQPAQNAAPDATPAPEEEAPPTPGG